MAAAADIQTHPGPAAVAARDLQFAWPGQEPVLRIPEFHIARGERLFLSGPSGSGKSTLLGLIGGVLEAGHGELEVLGTSLPELRPAQRDRFRAQHVGYIFQLFNLLPYLSVIENVVLPCRFAERRRQEALKRSSTLDDEAKRLLDDLGLGGPLLNRPVTELSIGQQQRVAAARALIGAPELLIADEPTSSLDQDVRGRFIDLLLAECETFGTAVLFVSHDASLGDHFDRQLALAEINLARGHH